MNNLHPIDRFARALGGIALLELAYFWLSGNLQIGAYAIGAVLLVTALVKFCPLYSLLGLRTGNAQTAAPGTTVGLWFCWIQARCLGTRTGDPSLRFTQSSVYARPPLSRRYVAASSDTCT